VLLHSTVRECVFERCTFANNYLAIDFSYGVARVLDCVLEGHLGWDLPPEFDPDRRVHLGHTVNGSIWQSGPAQVQGASNIVDDARLWDLGRRDDFPSHSSPRAFPELPAPTPCRALGRPRA
jgi:hypothetical protein